METNPEREQWHRKQAILIDKLATRMVELYVLDFRVQQSPEYEAVAAAYLWEQHIKAEHDKFDQPIYSDHRFG